MQYKELVALMRRVLQLVYMWHTGYMTQDQFEFGMAKIEAHVNEVCSGDGVSVNEMQHWSNLCTINGVYDRLITDKES